MIIVSGTSTRHMETLIDAPSMELKKLGFPPQNIEGKDTQWIVGDFGDVVLHVFDEATRRYYDLEGLWSQAPRLEWEARSTGPRILSL